MQTILKQTELAYNHISIQDAITMLPLMDELASKFQDISKQVKDLRDGTVYCSDEDTKKLEKDYLALGNQLVLLTRLGFTASLPGMIQFDFNDFPNADM